jgi:hypothetical protein
MQLAPGRAVHDLPATGAQLFADCIGRLERAAQPALDAFSQQLLSL